MLEFFTAFEPNHWEPRAKMSQVGRSRRAEKQPLGSDPVPVEPERAVYSTNAMSWPTTNGVVPSSSQSELSSEFPVRMTVSAMSWVQPLLLAELPENLTSEAGM